MDLVGVISASVTSLVVTNAIWLIWLRRSRTTTTTVINNHITPIDPAVIARRIARS